MKPIGRRVGQTGDQTLHSERHVVGGEGFGLNRPHPVDMRRVCKALVIW